MADTVQAGDGRTDDDVASRDAAELVRDAADDDVQPNPERDPSDWVTGDEPMTGPQASYLRTLSQEAGASFDPSLSKAEASQRIDALQDRTGRGA